MLYENLKTRGFVVIDLNKIKNKKEKEIVERLSIKNLEPERDGEIELSNQLRLLQVQEATLKSHLAVLRQQLAGVTLRIAQIERPGQKPYTITRDGKMMEL